MALETKLFTALSAAAAITTVVSSKSIWPTRAKDGAKVPYIVYQRISGGQYNDLGGYSSAENPRIQIDVYSSAYAQAKAIGESIHVALDATTTFKAILASDNDAWEPNSDSFRLSMDFSCINLE